MNIEIVLTGSYNELREALTKIDGAVAPVKLRSAATKDSVPTAESNFTVRAAITTDVLSDDESQARDRDDRFIRDVTQALMGTGLLPFIPAPPEENEDEDFDFDLDEDFDDLDFDAE